MIKIPAGVLEKLHSRYNPQAEAERYIEALNLNTETEYFILIEPGLGYMVPVLQNKFKNSQIIVLHAGSGFEKKEIHTKPSWYPGGELTVMSFLEGQIPDVEAAKIRIIEWRPAISVYGEAYLKVLSQAVEYIKRADAGRRTTAAFGKRWVKNFFRNLNLLKQPLLYRITDIPVIITGAGPGLEAALDEILITQEKALILAASSSLPALENAGIFPDLVVSTDGGLWALNHLYPCFRNINTVYSLAVSLSAALPSQCRNLPMLLLNDGSLWQSLVLKELSLPSVIIQQRGTVTASALDLALILSTGNIYLCGVDLSIHDIRTHARPYGFDQIFFGSASRLMPVYSQTFFRSSKIRGGGSYDIYAAWFRNQLSILPKRIFSFGGGNAVFENKKHIISSVHGYGKKEYFFKTDNAARSPDLCKNGAAALIRYLEDARYAESLNGELAPLLFPNEKKVSAGMLQKAIEEIAGRWGA
ncbi:MAG: DUF115 domain-containing protein [Treponema sp.]|nr:DUF115 domain-containing protein [Treponema sp.]